MSTAEPTSPVMLGALITVLGASTIFSFGYLKAKVERANSDYTKTKQSLPGLRKAYWQLWLSAMKVGFWVVTVGLVLIFWAINDTKAQP